MTDEPEQPEPSGITITDVLARSGATYRQIDYWARCGYLHPTSVDPDRSGSGFARVWSQRDVDVATHIVRLRQAGIDMDVSVAAAADAADNGSVMYVEADDGPLSRMYVYRVPETRVKIEWTVPVEPVLHPDPA